MVSALILAAGQSSRMGRLKQLLPLGNETVLGQTIEKFQEASLENIYVVVGFNAGLIKKALAEKKVTWIENPDYAAGMAGSIRLGISHLPHRTEAAFLALGDLPLIKAETIRKLLLAFEKSQGGLVVPVAHDRPGHPVLIAQKFFPDLLRLEGDLGARYLLKSKKKETIFVKVDDPGIHLDIDTLQDYEKLVQKGWC